MLNGSTLKIVFLGIVATLCFILLIMTILVSLGKIQVETYGHILGILGIPALFGMISQAFIHANINSAAKELPDAGATDTQTTTTTTVLPKTGV